MTIGLEKIEGMKIKLGNPIELTVTNAESKQDKYLGYYHGIRQGKKGDTISCDSNTTHDSKWEPLLANQFQLSDVEDVKVLKYKKWNFLDKVKMYFQRQLFL